MFVRAINYGHGFITHADRNILTFQGRLNNIWKVEGDEVNINIWIEKVSGTTIAIPIALAEIRLGRIQRCRDNIAELRDEITVLQERIVELGGII